MSFSSTLHGIEEELIHVLQLSQIIIHSLCKPVSVNFNLTGTFMFALSCLKFAVTNQHPIFTLFHIIESQK